jgi:hypothetical protein
MVAKIRFGWCRCNEAFACELAQPVAQTMHMLILGHSVSSTVARMIMPLQMRETRRFRTTSQPRSHTHGETSVSLALLCCSEVASEVAEAQAMRHELLGPSTRAVGRVNRYHVQFQFPWLVAMRSVIHQCSEASSFPGYRPFDQYQPDETTCVFLKRL